MGKQRRGIGGGNGKSKEASKGENLGHTQPWTFKHPPPPPPPPKGKASEAAQDNSNDKDDGEVEEECNGNDSEVAQDNINGKDENKAEDICWSNAEFRCDSKDAKCRGKFDSTDANRDGESKAMRWLEVAMDEIYAKFRFQ